MIGAPDKSLGFSQQDYLNSVPQNVEIDEIRNLRNQSQAQLAHARYLPYRRVIERLRFFKSPSCRFDQDTVTIGSPSELTPEQQEAFGQAIQTFIPWKKGPFELFGQSIDSEWRSDIKWQRILSHCSPLQGRRVADIGCHNGYFMFRAAAEQPEIVIGFEPVAKHYFNFMLMQGYAQLAQLYFELLGVEHIHHYREYFDTVLCMGILYHHTDPIGLLRKMRTALRAGGELIVDCQGIAGDAPVALTPTGRYANARGIWFLPTLPCLINWLRRANFRNIEPFYQGQLSNREQRTTLWAPIKSLKDFLDPNDNTRTIEGYPAPYRFYVRAQR